MKITKPNITKGEWNLTKYTDTSVENKNSRGVASCGSYQNNLKDETEENRANAKAISAVPDMIDALIHVRSVLCDDIGKESFPYTLKVIKKALTKAGCTYE